MNEIAVSIFIGGAFAAINGKKVFGEVEGIVPRGRIHTLLMIISEFKEYIPGNDLQRDGRLERGEEWRVRQERTKELSMQLSMPSLLSGCPIFYFHQLYSYTAKA